MESLDESTKENLINRLLKSKQSSSFGEEKNDEDLMKNLTPEEIQILSQLYASQQPELSKNTDKNYKTFLPIPGFCLKTKNSKDEKVFINICKSDEINAPKDITEQELIKLIDQMETENAAFHFRVPMSLGEPHSELDNSSCACVAYDVCINSNFLQKCLDNATFMGFFMSIVLDGLENKYSIKLDRNCKMLKNKKFLGKIQEQHIRTKSKPLISEVNANSEQNITSVSSQTDKAQSSNSKEINKFETPKYKIIREPQDGDIEFLVAEIELPHIKSAKSLTLDIGEDRIILNTRAGIYFLDIFLPYFLNQDECGAQFDKKTKILTITMPVIITPK